MFNLRLCAIILAFFVLFQVVFEADCGRIYRDVTDVNKDQSVMEQFEASLKKLVSDVQNSEFGKSIKKGIEDLPAQVQELGKQIKGN